MSSHVSIGAARRGEDLVGRYRNTVQVRLRKVNLELMTILHLLQANSDSPLCVQADTLVMTAVVFCVWASSTKRQTLMRRHPAPYLARLTIRLVQPRSSTNCISDHDLEPMCLATLKVVLWS